MHIRAFGENQVKAQQQPALASGILDNQSAGLPAITEAIEP
jgi:hypothetical protein